MENQSTYRIRTKLGETEPINIPVNLMQEYDSFEILSLNINTNDTYRSYTSTEGIVIGRVSTANNGLGIPNVRVSIFVPKGAYSQSDEEKVLYPFSSPTDMDGDRVRYNLLPSDSDVECYQVVGTLPTKRKILDNETVCEVFDKYYKYTTVTNEAGDFMLSNIPVGKQRIHIDADLSDIGPFLSQRPYNMIENLGFEKNKFESTRQFKTSKDLDSLAQIITQNKTVYVYPYWGDSTERNSEMKITRTDLSLNYEFKTGAIFIGSVITDKQSNSIRENCTPTENAGKMSEMVTGPGRIEMIRKTVDNKVEQFRIKGDNLINDNGVWCYTIPMNLDYVSTDEFGNIVPTDNPNKGIPTRARVRFRITLNDMGSDNDSHKRCSYLVPNNPKWDDVNFLKENNADYSFGSNTWDESFVDLLWNKVYTVKNYVPRIQKTVRPTNRRHTGIKMVNHFGDNNPFPYNSMSIKLPFLYRLICVIVHIFINLIYFVNIMISAIGALPCWLANVRIPVIKVYLFRSAMKFVPQCISLSSEFCDDGVNKNVTYPGCNGCVWEKKTLVECQKEQYKKSQDDGESAKCTRNDTELYNCVENQLAQQNEATSFNFTNDWINGCLYMPLWYRKIMPKKSYFFGLFHRSAKDQWCAGEQNNDGRQLKLASFCAHGNTDKTETQNYVGDKITHHIAQSKDGCGESCHEVIHWAKMTNGVIVNRQNMYGQKVWYYKATEVTSSLDASFANEYENSESLPMVSKTLYATDIVMLGSVNSCDLNGVPKFFNYLKGSTYNMPTDILFTDTEFEYTLDEDGNVTKQDSQQVSVSSGCDWGNSNEYGYNDGGLFYSIGCSTIKVDTASCINARRICELGVGQDEMKYVDNIDVYNITKIGARNINNENDTLDYNNLSYYLRPDGFISYDDIIDFDYRSMFATMNGNNLKTKINTKNGVREYDFRHLYVDNFDGSLFGIMKDEQQKRKLANYQYNYLLETTSNDYLTFRMGDRPFYYDGESLVQDNKNGGPKTFTLPKYQNSFYFYFGLKEGKTAIDLFNEQYNAQCQDNNVEDETIPYEKHANSWCANGDEVDGKICDGYLKIDFKDLPLPCSAILNSRENNGITYTIVTKSGDTNITNDKICFYGENTDDVANKMRGYTRYYFHYENTSYDTPIDITPYYMLNNGEYNMYVTDGEGNQHSFIVKIKGEYLQFDDEVKKFGQPNNVLLKYYKNVGEAYSAISYHSVAKSPDNPLKEITIYNDESGIPIVSRYDKDMKYVENTNISGISNTSYIKLNGTICIYNVMSDNKPIDKVMIEVEPYEKVKEGDTEYYVDKDFWKDETGKETWYNVKMFNDHTTGSKKECYDCTISQEDDKEYVTPGEKSKYFYYGETTFNNLTTRCYVIKCPKGGVDYRVRVTQLCEVNGKYYKTQNSIERRIYVGESTPYKLYINDVDYDIIKNFKTGWDLVQQNAAQTDNDNLNGSEKYRPFTSVGNINNIKGWLSIGDVNENYAWSEDPDKYGTEDKKFKMYEDGEYKGRYQVQVALEIKEDAMPLEPQRLDYIDEETYNEVYKKWQKDIDEWENGWLNAANSTRVNGYNDVSTINKDDRLGGCCGYTYVKAEAEILSNRLSFVNKMKSSFWIQDEKTDKSIIYTIQTDDNPYNIWTIYNPEYESAVDKDYNEADSSVDKTGKARHYWKCIGESTYNISGIKIPNITAYNSKDFGVSEDSVRLNSKIYENTYIEDKVCFGQDNISEKNKESGSVSIKPPYMVACVNYSGVTKPDNLTQGLFYDQDDTNKYGLQSYKFGEVKNNKRYIKNGQYEFFQFYLIDKIFSPDIVCWSYFYNIPYFRPYYNYNTEATEKNRLGCSVKSVGIVSGIIKNGITNTTDEVTDFEEKTIFEKDTHIVTYKNDNEDSIPTRRCILYGDITEEEEANLVYQNYRHTAENNVEKTNQYVNVPNKEGELRFIDYENSCETNRTLYGSMRISLKSTTLNDTSIVSMSLAGQTITIQKGEYGDETLTLKVNCLNSDTDNAITYYIFQVSMKPSVEKREAYDTKRIWYPLNKMKLITTDEEGIALDNYQYRMECDNDLSQWDGSTKLAQQFINKNTLEKHFKDKNNIQPYIADSSVYSEIEWENDEGDTQSTKTTGYGNTGVFTNLEHKPYCVIAVTENGCRAISPVYDFHTIYYVVGLVTEDGKNYLRTALVYVLKKEDSKKKGNKFDGNYESDGYDGGSIGPYCKKPRNYYLTRFNFNVDYTAYNDSNVIITNNIDYEYTKNKCKKTTSFTDDDPVGAYYVIKNTANNTYEVHTKTGGTIDESGFVTTQPSGEKITEGEYSYQTVRTINRQNGEQENITIWVIISINKNGNITIKNETENEPECTKMPTKAYIVIEAGLNPKYKSFTYSTENVTTLGYNPEIPYFMKYNDKELTQEEYTLMNSLLSKKTDIVEKSLKYYVTDVVGLRHRCKLHQIITKQSDWNEKVLLCPMDIEDETNFDKDGE